MRCWKFLQRWTGMTLAIVLFGCTAPTETPIALATSSPTSIPTQVPTLTLNPVATSVHISSFEECITAFGSWLQGTYPRQCITKNGEIFTEALEEGVIFSRTYGNTTIREKGRFITSTGDGGYLIVGDARYGCWVLKLDASREKEWEVFFEQELSQEFQLYSTGFSCLLARQTPDDGYVIIGKGYDTYSGLFQGPFFIITLDHEGNRVSGQVIAEKAGKIPYLDQDGNLIRLTSLGSLERVTESLDGGYIIVSKYSERSPESSTHMTKTDNNGKYVWDRNLCLDKNIQQAWEKKVVCSQNSYVWDVIQLQDGSFVITGVLFSGAWLLKTDVNGNVEWIREYGASGYALLPLSDGGSLIAGDQDGDGVLIKMDGEGNMQWSRTFGGIESGDGFTAMEQGLNSEITIMGSTGSNALWLLGLDSTIIK